MEAIHIFNKGRNGFGIFYRTEDLLLFVTLISTLARKMGICVIAFCLMFNHFHLLIKRVAPRRLTAFMQRLEIVFVKEYNHEYGRKGSLMNKSYGYSLKKEIKVILGSVAYVFNNPVAGRLCREATDYRWNLLAYHDTGNPFSERLRKRTCSKAMRRAIEKVDFFHESGQYLGYARLRSIFNGLDNKELKQIVDYILSKYNCLSYETLEALYGSYERMLLAINSNAGSEFDLKDEYGDHSCYRDMLDLTRKLGYSGHQLNFEVLAEEEADQLFKTIHANTKANPTCINKFLHLREA